jgi:hypothetical protein
MRIQRRAALGTGPGMQTVNRIAFGTVIIGGVWHLEQFCRMGKAQRTHQMRDKYLMGTSLRSFTHPATAESFLPLA